MIPGECIFKKEKILCNAGYESITLKVVNTGSRPIQVGSYFHFFETNRALLFDREKAFGKRLDILAGTAKRIEPNETTEVRLISIGGHKKAYGANGLTQGETTESHRKEAMKKIVQNHFKTTNS